MALVLRKGISIAAGTTKLRACDYEVLLELEQARQETAKELGQIMKKARQDGLRQGREDAQQELLDNVAKMKVNMDNWVKDTDAQLVQLVGECVQEVVEKADCVTVIRQSVARGLKSLQKAQAVQVRVHPKYTQEAAAILAQLAPNLAVTIIADGALDEADCIVQSPIGTVDLRLATRLRALKESIGL
jgi:flagellar biosynthesis/type III secretory pathway protein FliH